ncbi:MAG: response regulator [bacterium]
MAKILIVDDEKDLAFIVKRILEISGYEVHYAQSGYEAIEKVRKNTYNICLLDIRLPDMNGVEVFLKIKEIIPGVRVLMMTGFAVEDLIKQALKEGAYACIHKPFDIAKLLEQIESVLKSKKRVILIADDVERIRQELKIFLEGKKYIVYEAKNGEEVIARVWEKEYDIILLDYGLPDMNGLEIFRDVRKIDQDVLVMLMLDEPLESVIKDALKMGFYGWIEKPIDTNRLLAMLKEALKNNR